MIALVFCNKSELPENVFRDGQDAFRDVPPWPVIREWLWDGLLICGAVAIAWAVWNV